MKNIQFSIVEKVDESYDYWLKLAPIIWPTLKMKKAKLYIFKKMRPSFISKTGMRARINALETLIKNEERNEEK